MAFPGNTSKTAPGVSSAKAKAAARKEQRAQRRSERRAQRMEDFKNQNISGAGNFNFNQHNPSKHSGSTHVSNQEVNFLRKNNKGENGRTNFRDNLDALRAQKESGATFGKRAERSYQRMERRAGRIDERQKQRYTDHFNKIGKDKEDAKKLIEDYEKNTEGLDADKAFEALEGGRQFDPSGGDQARYEKMVAAKEKAQQNTGSTGQPSNPIDQTVTGGADSTPSNNHMNYAAVMPSADQEQKVEQDNDITTKIDGDNNKVFNHQDNSVRNYGGSQRTFVYQGGSGGSAYEDTPVSAATMGGFYDVDDSPAAQAQFNDMYKDFNKDNGTRFAGQAMATVDMFDMDARSYTPEAMETWLGKSEQYSYDKADEQTAQVFGDIWNKDYITEEWQMPTPPSEIKSEAADIADKQKDDIDDI